MPTTKQVLEMLTLAELSDIASAYDLPAADRRTCEEQLDAALQAGRVPLADLLGRYPRERLKELCRFLFLDDRGKEKAPLVAHLLDPDASQGSLKLALLIQHSILGATVNRIPLINFPKYPVFDPPNALKAKFEAFAAPLWARIHANQSQSRTLAALRDTLLPKLLSGEVRV